MPQLRERRTVGGQTGEWDGRQWVAVEPGGPSGPSSGPPEGLSGDSGALKGLLNALGPGTANILEGAGKGLAETGVKTGRMMSSPATDWLGNKAAEGASALGIGPDVSETAPATGAAAFPAALKETVAVGPGQKFGKGAEQIGEYFVGAKPARLASVEGLVRAIPNSANAAQVNVANKLAAILGRSVGEGANAAGTAALHGETNLDAEAGTAAAAPLVRAGVEGAIGNKFVRELLSILGAGAPAGLSRQQLAQKMGTFGMSKRLLADLLAKPGFQHWLGGMAEGGTRAAAGAQESGR